MEGKRGRVVGEGLVERDWSELGMASAGGSRYWRGGKDVQGLMVPSVGFTLCGFQGTNGSFAAMWSKQEEGEEGEEGTVHRTGASSRYDIVSSTCKLQRWPTITQSVHTGPLHPLPPTSTYRTTSNALGSCERGALELRTSSASEQRVHSTRL